jgi:hypothetical protein
VASAGALLAASAHSRAADRKMIKPTPGDSCPYRRASARAFLIPASNAAARIVSEGEQPLGPDPQDIDQMPDIHRGGPAPADPLHRLLDRATAAAAASGTRVTRSMAFSRATTQSKPHSAHTGLSGCHLTTASQPGPFTGLSPGLARSRPVPGLDGLVTGAAAAAAGAADARFVAEFQVGDQVTAGPSRSSLTAPGRCPVKCEVGLVRSGAGSARYVPGHHPRASARPTT